MQKLFHKEEDIYMFDLSIQLEILPDEAMIPNSSQIFG